jgi:single stranded DNA-binding protein
MNLITLSGIVGADPTLVTFVDSDNRVAKFSIAVKDYSSKQENPEPMWIDVDAWNGLGDRIMNLIKKGRKVNIHGRLAISKFEKEINGVKVKMKVPVVKLSEFELTDKKPNEEQASETSPAPKKSRKAA